MKGKVDIKVHFRYQLTNAWTSGYPKEPPTSGFMTTHLFQALPPCSQKDPFFPPLSCPPSVWLFFLFPVTSVILQHTLALCHDLARVLPGHSSLNFSLTLTLTLASCPRAACQRVSWQPSLKIRGSVKCGSTAQSVHTRLLLTASSQRCKA